MSVNWKLTKQAHYIPLSHQSAVTSTDSESLAAFPVLNEERVCVYPISDTFDLNMVIHITCDGDPLS